AGGRAVGRGSYERVAMTSRAAMPGHTTITSLDTLPGSWGSFQHGPAARLDGATVFRSGRQNGTRWGRGLQRVFSCREVLIDVLRKQGRAVIRVARSRRPDRTWATWPMPPSRSGRRVWTCLPPSADRLTGLRGGSDAGPREHARAWAPIGQAWVVGRGRPRGAAGQPGACGEKPADSEREGERMAHFHDHGMTR